MGKPTSEHGAATDSAAGLEVARRANPAAALVVLVGCFGAFAYFVDDIIRATSIFVAPFAALATFFVALAIIRGLPKR